MMRYSIPTCLPKGQLGDSCIPHNGPTNFTLSYPNGETKRPTESYRILCPCSSGLTCDSESNTCSTVTHAAAPQLGRKVTEERRQEKKKLLDRARGKGRESLVKVAPASGEEVEEEQGKVKEQVRRRRRGAEGDEE